MPCFDNSSQRVHSTHAASTKQVRTSIGFCKAILGINWPSASYYIKPNSRHKNLYSGKIPTEVFLVVRTKLNFRHSFAKGQKVCLKQWEVILELPRTQVWKSFFSLILTSKNCSRALTLPKQLTHKSEWAHKTYWKTIERKSKNSENQSPENGAFLKISMCV